MNLLNTLVAEAASLADPTLCSTGHTWVSDGGRSCPKDLWDCSQTVYVCRFCNAQDYGDKGGPAHRECMIECKRTIEDYECQEY